MEQAMRKLAFVGTFLALVGCTPVAQYPYVKGDRLDALPYEPAGAAYVETHADWFTTPSDAGLLKAAPGTVIDTLKQIDGCWGAHQSAPTETAITSSSCSCQFDFNSNMFTYQVIQRGGRAFQFDVAIEQTYEIRSVATDHIIVRLLATTYASTLFSDPGPTTTTPSDSVPEDIAITTAGDTLIFPGSTESAIGAGLLFTRMDCSHAN